MTKEEAIKSFEEENRTMLENKTAYINELKARGMKFEDRMVSYIDESVERNELAISALKEPTWQEKLEKEYLFESIKEDMAKLQEENERLLKEVEALKGEWIPVSERLPEDRYAVLVYCPEYKNTYCAYYENNQWWIFGAFIQLVPNAVVAWMPLPEPYKKGE